jgi:hypothetical protein
METAAGAGRHSCRRVITTSTLGTKKNTFGSPKWGPFSASKMGSFSVVFVLEMDPKMGRVWVPIFSTTEFID